MSRRSLTLVLSSALLLLFLIVAVLRPVPYVPISPSSPTDTLGSVDGKELIVVSGHPTYPTEGHLYLTTVYVGQKDARIGLVAALRDWIDPKIAIVPTDTVYAGDESQKQVDQQNADDMLQSQESAMTAAFRQLGYHLPSTVLIDSVAKDARAFGYLKAGDQVVAVDGKKITDIDQVSPLIQNHAPGQTIPMTVLRKGETIELQVPTRAKPGDPKTTQVGITLTTKYVYPFDVKIQLANVGGPSAGLMFALGIIDKLTPGPLNGGQSIAGTGAIDDEGNVGPIGGVQMKIVGARQAGATIFFAPKDNCAEAVANAPNGIKIVSIATLSEAMKDLDTIRAGQIASLPACSK